ncbi:MAG: TonB-dependent receptor, partial [Betaproteobacteria bacterium]|nr:TonB-dependent receptor [Betaproteobacteria bacterium]
AGFCVARILTDSAELISPTGRITGNAQFKAFILRFYDVIRFIVWASKIFWSASRKDSDFNSFVNASYAVVNLTASTLLSPQWRARVKLENAFGARYQLAYGYDAVPRGLFIGLQYQPLQHPSR